MVEKIYLMLWALVFAATGLIYFAGFLTAPVAVFLGLVMFGLTFLGMIGILPHYVTHHDTPLQH
ncbi:MAG: hypothetical protein KDB79_03240 [Acidobacteria bacterium]|nr:hypothetical protein [Acidobacteriota bacterium]